MNDDNSGIVVSRPRDELPPKVLDELRQRLQACTDVAFAHLVDVAVAGRDEPPSPTLFVWVLPQAMRSLRLALNVISEVVAASLPNGRFLDVLILNSVPELLLEVERAECLFVERDLEERQRALAAAADDAGALEPLPPRRSWWRF